MKFAGINFHFVIETVLFEINPIVNKLLNS